MTPPPVPPGDEFAATVATSRARRWRQRASRPPTRRGPPLAPSARLLPLRLGRKGRPLGRRTPAHVATAALRSLRAPSAVGTSTAGGRRRVSSSLPGQRAREG